MKSIEGNFDNQQVDELLKKHFVELRSVSPEGSTHVLDIEGLKDSSIKFWSLWENDALIGCGALKFLDKEHGEFKSIRIHDNFRKKDLSLDGTLNEIFLRMEKNNYDLITKVIQGKFKLSSQKGKSSFYGGYNDSVEVKIGVYSNSDGVWFEGNNNSPPTLCTTDCNQNAYVSYGVNIENLAILPINTGVIMSTDNSITPGVSPRPLNLRSYTALYALLHATFKAKP